MSTIRKFHLSTAKTPEGVIFGYHREKESLMLIEIRQDDIDDDSRMKILSNVFLRLNDFLNWCRSKTEITWIELEEKITFDMFWIKYNDRERSSKKRSMKLWDKMTEANQIKAYHHIDRYNRLRGSAEKKYAETYLNAELWNN